MFIFYTIQKTRSSNYIIRQSLEYINSTNFNFVYLDDIKLEISNLKFYFKKIKITKKMSSFKNTNHQKATQSNRLIKKYLNKSSSCGLFNCNDNNSANTQIRLVNKPPVFNLRPPPNPLNYLSIDNLFNLNLIEENLIINKPNYKSVDAPANSEKFLLYFLNLNNTNGDDDVTYKKDKCNSLRIQLASFNSIKPNPNSILKASSNKISKLNNVLDYLPISHNSSSSFSTHSSNANKISSTQYSIISTSTSINASDGFRYTNTFNFLLFSCISLITLSFIFFLFYTIFSR